MKMIILGGAVVFVLLILFLAWAGYPWSLSEKKYEGEIVRVNPEGPVGNEDFPAVVKVQTWNLGFLFGEGSEGPGYEARDKKFFEEKMNQLILEIKASQADVICLQEVDFGAHRSRGINQARYLAAKANYPHVAEAVSWEANYIPFPYWPISRHFGQMRSGGAILSKYPILSNEVTLLQKPLSQPWWYNVFYLHRYWQKVVVELGNNKVSFMNLHLEAFDKADRRSQIQQLVKIIKEEKVAIIAGDFNMLPASASKKGRFKNSDDDYENDPSYEEMMKSGHLEVIPDNIYAQDEVRYFTFPASKPDRRLDYIWYQPELKMIKAEVLPSALSDHLPLRAVIQISNPVFNPYSQ